MATDRRSERGRKDLQLRLGDLKSDRDLALQDRHLGVAEVRDVAAEVEVEVAGVEAARDGRRGGPLRCDGGDRRRRLDRRRRDDLPKHTRLARHVATHGPVARREK
jgi:hypothetical protein